MNHSCRLILNDAVKNCVPAAGFALQRTRRTTLARAIALALSSSTAFAVPAPTELPSGGQVTAGSAGIAVDGSRMDVNQASQNAGLNWQTFNIGQNAQVDFHQPNASAVAVNRIADPNGSQIMGRLNANGQVYLINPNGILFGQGSQVNVGGLVASTLDISDADAASNRRTFSSPANGGQGKIVNQGTITAAEGGYVALLGGQVSNQGLIQARLGTVALAAGGKVTLDFAGDKLLSVQVDQGALQALAENQQLIRADGGMVLMTAKAADSLIQAVVNNEGIVEARTIEEHNGVIKLLGDMDSGTVNVGGTLDASAPLPSPSGRGAGGEGADGGFIETSAAHVKVADDAKIITAAPHGKSGTWLIDPVDFTIATTNGDITGATLGTVLSNNGSVTIQTTAGSVSCTGGGGVACGSGSSGNGDIFVNDAVSWSANTLKLIAHSDIKIDANLSGSGSGTAKLYLAYGQQTANGNGYNYFLRNGAKVNLPAGANFTTEQGYGADNSTLGDGGGTTTNWTVITILGAENSVTGTDLQGMYGTNTTNTANLAGNYVLGADIDASLTSGWAGGFKPVGYSYAADVPNNKQFTGKFDGLGHTISNLSISRVGGDFGLFGATNNAVLQNVGLLNVAISGGSNGATGALAGRIEGTTTVRNCYVDGGSVSSTTQTVGGLVGTVNSGNISYSYADVIVSAGMTGGAGYAAAGGLVGVNNGAISYSYATGSVSAPSGNANSMYIGGLVGAQNAGGASISNSYATGAVSGNNTLGGLVGNKQGGTVTSSYWDETTTGQATSSGSNPTSGLTTAEWPTLGPFSSSPSDGAWSSADWGTGNPYPGVKALPYITITASASQSYGSAATFGIASILDQTGTNANGLVNTGSLTWSAGTTASTAAGTTSAVRGSGATGTGYQILYAGNLTVGKAPLTVTANGLSKTYDGLAYSGNNGVSYSSFVNGESTGVLDGALIYGGNAQGAINAGSYAITPSGLTSGNYAITFANGTLTVNAVPLTVTANGASKIYDGLAYSGGNGVFYSGFVNGEGVDVLGGTLAYGGSAQGAVNAGSYAITASGLTSSNYAITFADGSLTVSPAALTVTALNASMTYNGLAYSGGNGVSYSGFVNGEHETVLGGTLAWGGSSQGAANVGSYAITPSGLTSSNYAIAFADGSLAITPATLTYTATPASFFNGQTPTDNATPLTLKPGTPPEAVLNVMALLEADTLSSPVNRPPRTLSLSSTATVAEGSGPDSAEGGTKSIGGGDDESSPESGNGVTQNSEKSGSTFTIVQPGVKLPDYMVNLNE